MEMSIDEGATVDMLELVSNKGVHLDRGFRFNRHPIVVRIIRDPGRLAIRALLRTGCPSSEWDQSRHCLHVSAWRAPG
jgi:hypothetical protein